jgi:ElaB/YqjD/DUF883 family membrane-anchored ribosome-binding protein
MSLLYCYGVVGENLPIKQRGFENSTIYAIPFKGIFAVVSNVSKQEFSQEAIDTHVQDMQWLTQNAPLHESIVTNIMSQTTILPMKFCTVFTNEEQVHNMLQDKYADITYFLHRTKGTVEMSLKVYANISKLQDNLKKTSTEIQKLEEEAASKTPGQAYFVRQKADLFLKKQVQQNISSKKQSIINKTKELVELKTNDVLARKLTGKDRGYEMILNLALLVPVDKDLTTLVQEMQNQVYELQLSGPFAPYNFVK